MKKNSAHRYMIKNGKGLSKLSYKDMNGKFREKSTYLSNIEFDKQLYKY